jgi:hypothetical protein
MIRDIAWMASREARLQMMPYILPRRRKASSAPSKIRQTVALVFTSSIEPAATMLLLSLELLSAIICSASPKTAILALWVTTMTCRRSFAARITGTNELKMNSL